VNFVSGCIVRSRAPAERPVSESAQILFAHVRQNVAIDLPLKEVIRRLDGVVTQRRT